MSPVVGLIVPMKATSAMKTKCCGGGEGYSGRDHQPGARQEKRAQIITRSNQSDCEREHGGAEQRSGSDNSDLNRPKPERREIGGQDERREAVAKPPRRPRAVEIEHDGSARMAITTSRALCGASSNPSYGG